jgi:coenzyme PQQ precursor peptide PqqA
MTWSKPQFIDSRFGFEITMYIANREPAQYFETVCGILHRPTVSHHGKTP